MFGVALSIYAHLHYYDTDMAPTVIPLIKTTGWLWLPYFWITPFLSLALCKMIKIGGSFIQGFLVTVGVMSIEFYLIHGQFIELTRFLSNEYGVNKSLLGFLLVGASFIVSHYLHIMNVKVMNILKFKCLK